MRALRLAIPKTRVFIDVEDWQAFDEDPVYDFVDPSILPEFPQVLINITSLAVEGAALQDDFHGIPQFV